MIPPASALWVSAPSLAGNGHLPRLTGSLVMRDGRGKDDPGVADGAGGVRQMDLVQEWMRLLVHSAGG